MGLIPLVSLLYLLKGKDLAKEHTMSTKENIENVTNSRGSIKRISTQELYEQLENGPVALFDIRGDVAYEQGHIPGAKTAPRGSLGFRVASNVNPDTFVVIYADGREGDGAIDAVERLEGLRLTNVHLYEDGLEGWWLAGHDLVESPNAKVQARGPVEEVRSILVDRERAYGGAFRGAPFHHRGLAHRGGSQGNHQAVRELYRHNRPHAGRGHSPGRSAFRPIQPGP